MSAVPPNITSSCVDHAHSGTLLRDIFDEKCAKLSHAVVQFKKRLETLNEPTLVCLLVGAYIVLIALLAGANTLPSLPNPVIEINNVVRGLIGG